MSLLKSNQLNFFWNIVLYYYISLNIVQKFLNIILKVYLGYIILEFDGF